MLVGIVDWWTAVSRERTSATPRFDLVQPAEDQDREELTFPQTANVVDGDDVNLIDFPRDGVGMRDDALGKACRHCLGNA